MHHPEHLYWALIAFVAFPMAAVSRLAGILVAVWAIAMLLIVGCHLDMVSVYLWLHLAALVFGVFVARGTRSMYVAFLFFPLFLFDLADVIGMTTEATWWWNVYWLAVAQVLMLPHVASVPKWPRAARTWARQVRTVWFEIRSALAWI